MPSRLLLGLLKAFLRLYSKNGAVTANRLNFYSVQILFKILAQIRTLDSNHTIQVLGGISDIQDFVGNGALPRPLEIHHVRG